MKQIFGLLAALLVHLAATGCKSENPVNLSQKNMNSKPQKDTAIFAGGCFWCVEAIFQQLTGVDTVISGYIGGTTFNPTYEEVCTGKTGHAEAIQIIYDPSLISFRELCEIFYVTHDPTTLNRQGADVGTQYRSGIFFLTPEQGKIATQVKQEVDASGTYPKPVVTEITQASAFYPAETYHQNYFNQNQNNNPYCQAVIVPKVQKFQKTFQNKLKK